MIKVINKVRLNRTNPKSFLDINELTNDVASDTVDRITRSVKKIKTDSPATVIIEGDPGHIKCSVDSMDDVLAKKIQSAIDAALK